MAHAGTSIAGFFARFPNEQSCLDQIFKAKSTTYTVCPSCKESGGKWIPIPKTKKYRHSCGLQTSPLKDTVLYRSNLSLMAWFYALLLFTNSQTGMRSSFVRRQLGIGVKSAHRLCNKLRIHLACQARPATLGGPGKLVHIDEAYFRVIADSDMSRRRNAIVLGFACDGFIICGAIPDCKRLTITPLIDRFVSPGSTIVTDGAGQYRRLRDQGWKHVAINHKVAFHNFEGVTSSPIETYWRVLRRTLRLYRQVADHNLWGFLAEVEFRYNRRHSTVSLFDEAIGSFPEVSPQTIDEIRSRFDWR